MEQIEEWLATGYRPSEKGPVWGPTKKFSTKREAVRHVEGNRESKTAIVRNGHAYIFQLRK
ncbi:MAG: hypothetical protein HY505_00975 [Candidatus Yanofskybacteria bacterium]|nr:hypothetical protein [Candidatus Yanofskybacteria bacterium]